MKKRVLSLILCLCMAASLLPGLSTGAEAALSGYTASSYMQYLDKTSSYDIQGRDTNDGRDDAIMTTFSNGGYKTYMRDASSDYNPTRVDNGGSAASVEMNYSLDFSDGGRYVRITYILRNTTGGAVTVDFGFGADVKVFGNDQAPIKATDKGLKMFENADDMDKSDPEGYVYDLKVNGLNGTEGEGGAGDPDTVWFGRYSEYVSRMFGESSTGSLTGIDSGIAVGWSDVAIPANGSVTIEYKMGVLQKTNMTVATTDAGGSGSNGTINVSVAGGSGSFKYGYLYDAATPPAGAVGNVPASNSSSNGQWQDSPSFASGVLPGYYRVFYNDTAIDDAYDYKDIVIYGATKLMYDLNGGGGVTPTETYARRGGYITLPKPARQGYQFDCWTITHGGGSITLGASATYMIPDTDADNQAILQDTITLRANWVKSGTITYQNVSGGDAPGSGYMMPSPQTVAAGTVLTLQNLTAPEHWTFDGWYKGADRTTLLPGGAVTTISDGDLTGGAGSFGLAFHARWTKDATLTFATGEAGGNAAAPEAIYVYPGSTVSLPAAPGWAGHSFTGWLVGGETYPARGAYTTSAASGATAAFTAQWVVSSYEIGITLKKGNADYISGGEAPTGRVSEGFILIAELHEDDGADGMGGAVIKEGNVTFYDGSQVIGSAAVGADGRAYFNVASTAKGAHSYSAEYGGSAKYPAQPEQKASAIGYTSTDKERPESVTLDITGAAWAGTTCTKTYDKTLLTFTPAVTWPAGVNGADLGFENGMVSITYNGSSVQPTAAGTYTVRAAISDTDDWYAAESVNYTLVIEPAQLTPKIACAEKMYDGNTTAALTVSFDAAGGLLAGDSIVAAAIGSFESADAGAAKAFTISDIYISGGNSRDNYVLAADAGTNAAYRTAAAVTPAIVTFSVSNTSQIYDGSEKPVTVVGGSSPAKEWKPGERDGYDIAYYKCRVGTDGEPTNKTTPEKDGGALSGPKTPRLAGWYIYEITCTDGNYRLSDGRAAQTGLMEITSGGVADFKFSTASGGARFYANTMHVTYGDAPFTFPAASEDVPDGAVTYSSDSEGVVTVGDDGKVSIAGVGNAVITATLTAENYVTTTAQYAVDVGPAALTVTAGDAAVIYGDGAPAFSCTVEPSGLKNGDGADVVTGTARYECAYASGSSAGSYAIGVSGLAAANYAISYAPGKLTVAPKTITPVITAVSKVYDGTKRAEFTVDFSGQLVGGDRVYAQAMGEFESADAGADVGAAVTDCTLIGATNYVLNPEKSAWTVRGAAITPAPVTYIVNGRTHTYDGNVKGVTVVPIAVPAMTGGYETAYAQGGAGVASPSAEGVYDYTVSTTNGNYTGGDTGVMEITASAQPVFQFTAPIVTAVYGESVTLRAASVASPAGSQSVTYSIAGSDSDIADIDPSTGVVTIKKAGNVTVTATSRVPSYVDASATCALIISKAPLTVTAAAQTKVYGEPNPALDAADISYSGWKYSDGTGKQNIDESALACTYSCGERSGVGSYTVTPSGLASDCYDFRYVPGAVTITRRPVFVTVVAADKDYDAGTGVALTATAGAVENNAASGIVSGDIIPAAATGAFESRDSGPDRRVNIAAVSLTGGGNYEIAGHTTETTANINETPVSFTALYVPSQYSADIGLTIIRDPNIARALYTVEYYKDDPSGKTDDGAWKAANAASDAGRAPVFPGMYWYYIYANAGSGYSGSATGSYAIDNMTQDGHPTAPVVTVNAGSTRTNPIIHTSPKLGGDGRDDYGNAPVFEYKSSDSGVASIGGTDGVIRGVSVGTATITATCTFEGYFTKAWQYSVTVTSTSIDMTQTGTVLVSDGETELKPTVTIKYTPTTEGGSASEPVDLKLGTEASVGVKPDGADYAIFLRDSRAVGEEDTDYPYIDISDGANGGVADVGHYRIFIKMSEDFAAAGYGNKRVEIGHFYVIPAAPGAGVAGGGEDIIIDYVNETISWDGGTFALAPRASEQELSTWADETTKDAVSERPNGYESPHTLAVGDAPLHFAAWKLGGEVNMSTQPGAVKNITLPARPAAPASETAEPIHINVTTTANSITVKSLANYTPPASGVQYAACPEGEALDEAAAQWSESVITGLSAQSKYTVYIRVRASNDATSPSFASAATAVTVTGGEPGDSAPTPDGGAATGSPPATIWAPAITESGTLKGSSRAGGGTGRLSGTQGVIDVSADGRTVTITAPAKYRIADVLADGVSVGSPASYTFEDVTNGTTLDIIYEWDDPFDDVTDGDWYFEAVREMHISGIVDGTSDSTFSPGLDAMRVALVTVLGRLQGIDEADFPGSSYGDVLEDGWYAAFVQWATQNGIVDGYDGNTFGVADSVTREQAATILYRYAREYMKLNITLQRPNLIEAYQDSSSVSPWAYEAMRWCLEAGVLSGRGNGILAPGDTCTRAELAQLLVNFMRYMEKA